uniref:Uncharacterized protein AlNc14C377G11182 n=1 Tax=Albugo laibachii Nc14 TaxID=890382 RepID=F0WYC3_9STRA|nr:conserved hypothetical protein [Albugo laibachii Nc14]|eukprot:CCA26475.1 conserved hypothetical protein [Albugo laibachii Nc14]
MRHSRQRLSAGCRLSTKEHEVSALWKSTKGFRFGPRDQKLDTQSLFQLDIANIRASTDIATLQKHVENLTFSDVTVEDIKNYSDPYFLKLFQIAQMMLEYMLSVQESLLRQCSHEEEHCERLLLQCTDLKGTNDLLQDQVSELQKDIRYRKRTIATLETMLQKDAFSKDLRGVLRSHSHCEYQGRCHISYADVVEVLGTARCDICGKVFVSMEYLQLHKRRKHCDEIQRQSIDLLKGSAAVQTDPPSPVLCAGKANSDNEKLLSQLEEFRELFQIEKQRKERENKAIETGQEAVTQQMQLYWKQMQEMILQIQANQNQTHQAMESQKEQLKMELLAQQQDLLRAPNGSNKEAFMGELQNDDDEDERLRYKSETRQLETVLQTLVEMQREKHDAMEKIMLDNCELRKEMKRDRMRSRKCNALQVNDLAQMMTLENRRFGTLIPGLNESDNSPLGVECDQVPSTPEPEAAEYPSPITILEAPMLLTEPFNQDDIIQHVMPHEENTEKAMIQEDTVQKEMVQEPRFWTLTISPSQIAEQFGITTPVDEPVNIYIRRDSTAHTLQVDIARAVTLVSREDGDSNWTLDPASVQLFHAVDKVKLHDDMEVFNLKGFIEVEFLAGIYILRQKDDAALRIQCTIRCFFAKKRLNYRKLCHKIRLRLDQHSRAQFGSDHKSSQLEMYALKHSAMSELESIRMDKARNRIEKQVENQLSEIEINAKSQRPPSYIEERVQQILGKLNQSGVDGNLRKLQASCVGNGFCSARNWQFLRFLLDGKQLSTKRKGNETVTPNDQESFSVSVDEMEASKIDDIEELADAYEDACKTPNKENRVDRNGREARNRRRLRANEISVMK